MMFKYVLAHETICLTHKQQDVQSVIIETVKECSKDSNAMYSGLYCKILKPLVKLEVFCEAVKFVETTVRLAAM